MNDHDKIFKEIESIKENAADFIQGTFPKHLVQQLDLDSLKLEKTSYLDDTLKESFSDLVYSCTYSGKTVVTITLLFEHKSYPVRHPHLQLLRYMLRIWDAQPKKQRYLQPVIPVIFYHGRKRWTYRSFAQSFAGVDVLLERFVPHFDYLLTDLSQYDARAIRETIFKRDANRILMQLLKYVGDERLIEEHFQEIFAPGTSYFSNPEGESFLISVLVYIYHTVDLSPGSIVQRLSEISREGGQIAMTTATRLHEEGKRQGIQEERRMNAQRMLADNVPIQAIAKYTGLSIAEIEALRDEKD